MGSGNYLQRTNQTGFPTKSRFYSRVKDRGCCSPAVPHPRPCAPGAGTTGRGARAAPALLRPSTYRPLPRGLSRAGTVCILGLPGMSHRGTEPRPGPDTGPGTPPPPPASLPRRSRCPRGRSGRGCAPPAPAPPGAPRAPPPFPARSAGRARPLHLSPRRTHSA